MPEDFSNATAGSDEGYLFVDNARFLSILFIVARHAEVFESEADPLTALESWIIQLRSFGVLTFLIISAFLMARKVNASGFRGSSYWSERARRLAAPWAVWLSINIGIDAFKNHFLHPGDPWSLGSLLYESIFYRAYWYVPVLLISLGLLLPLRRFWNRPWFGYSLLALTVLHGVNRYFDWFPSAHTVALLGYVFYLWLGVQIFQRFAEIKTTVRAVSWGVALGALALSFAVTRYEGHLLGTDAFNPLNLSNQLYAMVCLGILIKLPFRLPPRFVDVRKASFGIYLSHLVIASLLRGAIDLVVGLPRDGRSMTFFGRLPEMVHHPVARVAVWLAWFVVVYVGALVTTKILLNTPLAWLVGGTRTRAVTSPRS